MLEQHDGVRATVISEVCGLPSSNPTNLRRHMPRCHQGRNDDVKIPLPMEEVEMPQNLVRIRVLNPPLVVVGPAAAVGGNVATNVADSLPPVASILTQTTKRDLGGFPGDSEHSDPGEGPSHQPIFRPFGDRAQYLEEEVRFPCLPVASNITDWCQTLVGIVRYVWCHAAVSVTCLVTYLMPTRANSI